MSQVLFSVFQLIQIFSTYGDFSMAQTLLSYLTHHPGREAFDLQVRYSHLPWREIAEAIAQLKQSGRLVSIGSQYFTTEGETAC